MKIFSNIGKGKSFEIKQFLPLGALFCLTLLLGYTVWFSWRYVDLSRDVEMLLRQQQGYLDVQRKMLRDISFLESPSNLEKAVEGNDLEPLPLENMIILELYN